MDAITFRRWKSLTYHDPAAKLRQYRAVEAKAASYVAGQELGPGVREALALRTNELNRFRELRDGALFTYGMGLATGKRIGIADDEDVDHDFMTAWVEDETPTFCPVQLKELASQDRDPGGTIEGLLSRLPKQYAPTKTVLVVRLSRAGHAILDRNWPAVVRAAVVPMGVETGRERVVDLRRRARERARPVGIRLSDLGSSPGPGHLRR